MLWHVTPPSYNTKVTVELGELIDNGLRLWDFDYPSFYKGDQKLAFEQKVIDHFRFRQIGQETPARFVHYFRSRVREIMPYYVQLYESEALMREIDDPFGNVDIVETFEEERSGSKSDSYDSSSSGTIKSDRAEEKESRFSDTPHGTIENLDNYLTSASRDNVDASDDTETSASGSGSSQGSETGTVKHTLTKKGNQGVNTYAHDMRELRETFLNIDAQIIGDLNDLFLKIY